MPEHPPGTYLKDEAHGKLYRFLGLLDGGARVLLEDCARPEHDVHLSMSEFGKLKLEPVTPLQKGVKT